MQRTVSIYLFCIKTLLFSQLHIRIDLMKKKLMLYLISSISLNDWDKKILSTRMWILEVKEVEKIYICTCFSEPTFSTLREMGLERKHLQRSYIKSDTKKINLSMIFWNKVWFLVLRYEAISLIWNGMGVTDKIFQLERSVEQMPIWWLKLIFFRIRLTKFCLTVDTTVIIYIYITNIK